ncbi:MAG: AAA family ATPase [Acidimicrobiia bacterium]|nr:AAA family ATPase [Acidimicrobiia bacterium]
MEDGAIVEPDTRAALVGWLLRRGDAPEIVETHVSVLGFQGDRAYKAKKAVCFDFLDLSTSELRAAACEREVSLNQRLAPDVYLGTVDITDADGLVVERAVEMRRMPAARRLATLVRSGVDAGPCIDSVAETVARFHALAERSETISATARRDAIADLWERGFAETRPFVGSVLDAEVADRVELLARRYLAGRDPLFESRIVSGRICDGHGDLLADDVFCLDDGPRILDCLEFDDRLPERRRAGRRRVPRHGPRATGAARPGEEVHRPLPRSHVRHLAGLARAPLHRVSSPRSRQGRGLRHGQGDPAAADRARVRFALAAAHLEAQRVRLVLVGGLPGTGKSTLAAALAAHTGAALERSDVTRKAMAGLAATHRTGDRESEGLYAPNVTDAVYRGLLDTARGRLAGGESVILDASWAGAAHRRAAERIARDTASDLLQIRCEAMSDVAAARISLRAAEGADPSDASVAVATAMAQRFEPWPDAATLDTTSLSPEATLERAVGLLPP